MDMSRRGRKYNKPLWFGWTAGTAGIQPGKADCPLEDRDFGIPDDGNTLNI